MAAVTRQVKPNLIERLEMYVFVPEATEPATHVGAIEPLQSEAKGDALCVIPLDLDAPLTEEGVLPWMDCLVEGSSPAPTLVLALVLGQSAFYLLFNAGDQLTRAAIKNIKGSRRLTVNFKSHVLTEDGAFFDRLWPSIRRLGNAPLGNWMERAQRLIPALPNACALQLPELRIVTSHHAVLMFPGATLRAAAAARNDAQASFLKAQR